MSVQTYEEALHSVTLPPSNYYDNILYFSKGWIKEQGQFTTEILRSAYESQTTLIPAEPRVYGAVVKDLQKEKMIQHSGYTTAQNKQAHNRPISLWKVQ
jgi:hypothetical protein